MKRKSVRPPLSPGGLQPGSCPAGAELHGHQKAQKGTNSWPTRLASFGGFLGLLVAIPGFVLVFLVAGCAPEGGSTKNPAPPQARAADPLAVALAPHEGAGKLDVEIRRFQEQARAGRNPELALERLGWLFVAKARESFDSGFYRLAEQCALCLESRQPNSAEALLLRGHVLHNLHRFKEAEPR